MLRYSFPYHQPLLAMKAMVLPTVIASSVRKRYERRYRLI